MTRLIQTHDTSATHLMCSRLRCTIIWLALVIFFSACEPTNKRNTQVEASTHTHEATYLKAILANKTLTAIIEANTHTYYIDKGHPSGFELEMLQSFANYLEVDLNIVVSHSLTESLEMLSSGQADILADGLAITKQRQQQWLFGPNLFQSQQVLIQRLPQGWRKMALLSDIESHLLRQISDLNGKKIYVPTASVYANRLKHIAEETGSSMRIADTILSVDSLVALVAKGKINYTICDDHIAFYNKVIHNNIDIKTKIGNYRQHIAWAMPMGADSLQHSMQKWLHHIKRNKTFYYIYNKYYKNPYKARQVKKALAKGIFNRQLSPYDSLIQHNSHRLGWDWRLLASLICQESGFKDEENPVSHAFGVMQMIPETADIYGLQPQDSIAAQIAAGSRYLKALDKEIAERVSDANERQKFVLAAYNVGVAHVFDAMRLTQKYGKDPAIWYRNVEDYMLLLAQPEYYKDTVCYYGYCRGSEPYNYVREIENRYQHYRNLLSPATIKKH